MGVRRYPVAVLTLVLLSAGPLAAQTLHRADTFGGLKSGSTARVPPIGVSCAQELDECGLIPLGIVLPVVGAGLGALVGGCLPRWLLRYARTGPG